jgi:hypothetical protein
VRHLRAVTKPIKGELWQEIVCQVSSILAAILGSFGGESPFFQYLVDKCDLPSNT